MAASLIVSGHSPFLATLAAFIAGGAVGCLTGILNTKAKISDLLSGILTMTSLYSINLRIMGQPNIPLLNQPTVFSLTRDFLIRFFSSAFLINIYIFFPLLFWPY